MIFAFDGGPESIFPVDVSVVDVLDAVIFKQLLKTGEPASVGYRRIVEHAQDPRPAFGRLGADQLAVCLGLAVLPGLLLAVLPGFLLAARLLFGCLLEWGLPLSLPYTSETIEGATVHTYNDGDLVACFDENISDAAIKAIAKKKPLRAVFRDSSFADSPAKINVGEIFKMLSPDTRVKVI